MRTSQHSVPVSYRLVVAGVIAILLLVTCPYEPIQLQGILWLGGWSAIAVALLMPVLIRGDWMQRLLALLLLLLPLASLFFAFLSAVR